MIRSLSRYPIAVGELKPEPLPCSDLSPAVIDLLDHQAHWMLFRPREFGAAETPGRYWESLTIAEIEERAAQQMREGILLDAEIRWVESLVAEGPAHVQ